VQLAGDHPSPYYYETRGGARIVHTQAEPSILRSRADALEWAQCYAIACAYLRRRYGIEADPSCADWTRLFRLPRATRDRAPRPENYPTLGTPGVEIGELYIRATREDMRAARESSKAFQERRGLDLTHVPSDGMGLLYHLLRARDAVGRRHGEGWLIRCPNAAQHTAGRDWDSSTVLYPPSRDHEIGAIHCMHQHCCDLTIKDWLAMFSEAELDAARDAAGIRRREAR
jgi:hypothetical protein